MISIKKPILFLLFYFALSNVYSQNKPKTLLWRVSKAGNENVSYLFGTFHQVNPDFFDSLLVANKSLIESKILFVESYESVKNNETINVGTINEKVEFEEWNKEKWKANLTVKQFSTFEKFSKSKWVDERIFELEPTQLMFYLHYMYFQGICDTLKRKSYDAMDTRITNIGLANKLTIVGLDENQIQDIKTSSEIDKPLSLKNVLKSDVTLINYILEENTDNPSAKFLFDYRNKNLNYSINKKSKLNYLLNGRNDKWMKILPEKFGSTDCFVAVGIRHLYYKTGLIQQLRNKGFIVEPVEI